MATRLHRDVSAPSAAAKRISGSASASADAEHILLETGEEEFEGANAHRVLQSFNLTNRIRRLTIELVLFDRGWLSVRERRHNELGKELIVKLRTLDPKPLLSRFYATTTLRIGLYLMIAGALLGWIVHRLASPSLASFATSGLMLACAGVALWLFARRTREEVTFRTLHAQTTMLILTANFGSFRACRALVPKLVQAINVAHKDNPRDKSRQLRDEMREHYRLREIGFLTDDAFSAATQRILAQFGSNDRPPKKTPPKRGQPA
jgi:hypothetical protein